MADQIILTDVSVEVDDNAWPVKGNSLSYTEGLGESSVESATQGGKTILIVSQDTTTKVSMVKFEVPTSIDMMNQTRDVHAKGAGRTVRISGTDQAGNRLGRTFKSAIVVSDPEKAIQNEGSIPVEFKSAPAIPS